MVGVLDLGIDLNVWPWIWIGIAVIFALIELTALAGSFVLLPFAVSAFAASLAGFYDAPVELQWAIFIVGGAGLWMLFWRYAKRFANDNAMPEGVGADRLVGMTAIVTATIDRNDINRRGRVKVAGEEWGALPTNDMVLPPGSKVKVTAMEGTRVVVEHLDLAAPTEPPSQPPNGPPRSAPPSSPQSPSPQHPEEGS
ncbi:MAG: NfeD family protein [Ilumatobacter sp.]|jgi:membrane protein implicated in regulation of membrane protease activity|uniref:NfeD family protein n=1 Tax=Ilumatobacter sp. TaxID=1967498 RepID=UPI00391CCB8F